jgi:hypothetical protein
MAHCELMQNKRNRFFFPAHKEKPYKYRMVVANAVLGEMPSIQLTETAKNFATIAT